MVYSVDLPIKNEVVDVAKHRAAVIAAVTDAGALVAARLQSLGATIVWASSSAPLLRMTVPGAVLTEQVKREPSLLFVGQHKSFVPKLQAAQSSIDLDLLDVFYHNNQYGQGIKVGVSGEQAAGNCRLPAHPYYIFGQIVYSSSSYTACQTDADCTSCVTTAGAGACSNGVCVPRHGAMVVGMIGHAMDPFTPREAPRVSLYFNSNSSWGHGAQLDWFYSSGVLVENESWSGAPDIFKQDYYPIAGMAITEAAGNAVGGNGDNAVSSCAANTICVAGYLNTSTYY